MIVLLKETINNWIHNYHNCWLQPAQSRTLVSTASAQKFFNKCFTFWHTFHLVFCFCFAILHVSGSCQVWSNLVHSSPVLKSLASSRWLQSAPLPASFPLNNPRPICDHSLSLLQSMWVLWFHYWTIRPLSSESRRTDRKDQQRERHLFIIQPLTVAKSLYLRSRDWLFTVIIYTTAPIGVSLTRKSQLLQWVNGR